MGLHLSRELATANSCFAVVALTLAHRASGCLFSAKPHLEETPDYIPWPHGGIGIRTSLRSWTRKGVWVQVPLRPPYRGVEKWLSRQRHKLKVDGSIPSSATNYFGQ